MTITSILTYTGSIPWPTTTIMVGVHGNEKAGALALQKLLQENYSIDTGMVYFIYANLKALQIDKRYIEKNMNRCFSETEPQTTYEAKRAKEIMGYLEQSDYLLDVHNTINRYNSVPMLISEYPKLGRYFDVSYIVSWFDKLHPGGSDSYMNSLGKIWLCIECWSIYDDTWPKLALRSIKNFLRYAGNIQQSPTEYTSQSYIRFYLIYKNKNIRFIFTRKFLDMEEITKGDIIAYDGPEPIIAQKDCYILFTQIPKNIWDECFVLGNKELK